MINPVQFPQRRPQGTKPSDMISMEQHNQIVNALKYQSVETVMRVMDKISVGIADLLESVMAELESKPIPTPEVSSYGTTTPNSGKPAIYKAAAENGGSAVIGIGYGVPQEFVQNGLAPVRPAFPEVDKTAIANAMTQLSPEIKEALREMLAEDMPMQRTVIVESSGPIPGMFGFGKGF